MIFSELMTKSAKFAAYQIKNRGGKLLKTQPTVGGVELTYVFKSRRVKIYELETGLMVICGAKTLVN